MGVKTKSSIEHKTKKNVWTTVLVEWSDHDGSFHVNSKGIFGVFICKDHAPFDVGGLSIGGSDAISHSLNQVQSVASKFMLLVRLVLVGFLIV